MSIITKHIRDHLEQLVKQQSKESAIEIYSVLVKQGFKYARLAKGVAKGNTLIGILTIYYLQIMAKKQTGKIIGNKENCDIQLDKIKIQMANEYAQYIIDQYDNAPKITEQLLIKEITLITMRTLHSKVFKSFELSTDVWILAIPFKLLDRIILLKKHLLKEKFQ